MYVHARTWYCLLGYFRELIIRFVLCRMQGNSTSGLAGCSIAYHVHWRKRTPLLCASPTQRSGRYTRIQNGTSFIRLQQRRICPQDQWRLLWNCRQCLNDIELVKLQFCCFSSTLPSLTYIFVAEQITKEKYQALGRSHNEVLSLNSPPPFLSFEVKKKDNVQFTKYQFSSLNKKNLL